jgi:hypothetical protein
MAGGAYRVTDGATIGISGLVAGPGVYPQQFPTHYQMGGMAAHEWRR